mmetsp:Transcript_234/g.606  ORF Transcript_234/g.606 Transcript_234/m.606 type:complete len:251 (-) Transcript_234:480-1232(-)
MRRIVQAIQDRQVRHVAAVGEGQVVVCARPVGHVCHAHRAARRGGRRRGEWRHRARRRLSGGEQLRAPQHVRHLVPHRRRAPKLVGDAVDGREVVTRSQLRRGGWYAGHPSTAVDRERARRRAGAVVVPRRQHVVARDELDTRRDRGGHVRLLLARDPRLVDHVQRRGLAACWRARARFVQPQRIRDALAPRAGQRAVASGKLRAEHARRRVEAERSPEALRVEAAWRRARGVEHRVEGVEGCGVADDVR